MGYHTSFEFSYSTGNGKEQKGLPPDVLEFLKNADECEKIGIEQTDEIEDALNYNEPRWYNYDGDMKLISERFPQYMFILFGIGEESMDIWRNVYFKGERVYEQMIQQLPPLKKKLLTFKVVGNKNA